jgi:hypothetical protein
MVATGLSALAVLMYTTLEAVNGYQKIQRRQGSIN